MRLTATILAAALAVAPLNAAMAEGGSASSGSIGSGFGAALNEYRAQNGRGPLHQDAALTRAAQAHAEDMASHGYFSHYGRNGSDVTTRARAAGCRGGGGFAENIAWGQPTANHVFQGWANSSGHRANMLGSGYGAYGLGQANGYWVLVFAGSC